MHKGLGKTGIAEQPVGDQPGQDIRDEVKALGGADVVYDPVGGDQWKAALRAALPE